VQAVLVEIMGVSRRMIQRLTRSRGILHNRRPAFLGRTVRVGDRIEVRVAGRERPNLAPRAMRLSIVHEDDALLVLDKPAGMLVHPTSRTHQDTLAHAIAHHFREQGLQAKVRPVHRLDRDTSGLVITARSAFAHQHLDRQIRRGEMIREYVAIVEGNVEGGGGVIEAPIGPHPRKPNLRTVDPAGQPAITRYEVMELLEGASLLRVSLETGRTHQIRVHLAQVGHPVLNDRVYGGTSAPDLTRFALHSSRCRFLHPTTHAPTELEAPLPADLLQAIEARRRDPDAEHG
jgi:23S rRNA pseudouridine1911/1915/1917 synthase